MKNANPRIRFRKIYPFLVLLGLLAAGKPAYATQHNIDLTCTCVSGNEYGVRFIFSDDVTVTAVYSSLNGNTSGWPNGTSVDVEHDAASGTNYIDFIQTLPRPLVSTDVLHFGVTFAENESSRGLARFIDNNKNLVEYLNGQDCFPRIDLYEVHAAGVRRIDFVEPDSIWWYDMKLKLEYYKIEQPLDALNGYTPRSPIRIDSLDIPKEFHPHQKFSTNFDPPSEANYVVLVTSGRPEKGTPMTIWSEYPIQKKAVSWIWWVIALLILILAGAFTISRFRSKRKPQ